MPEGRSVLVDGNELTGPEPQRKSSRFTSGAYNELRLGDTQQRIILVKGAYQNRFWNQELGVVESAVEPFFRYMRHNIPPAFQTPAARRENFNERTQKTRWTYLACTRGPDPNTPQECRCCSIASRQLEPKPRKVFTVVHLHPYHLTPSKQNPENRYPKLCLSDIENVQCPGCRDGLETIGGARKFIDITDTDYTVLFEQAEFLRNQCTCGGRLGTTELVCSRCGASLLTFTPENADEFKKAMKVKKFFCQRCGVQVKMNEMKACENGCEPPVPRSLFNVVLTVKKSKEAGKSFSQINILDKAPAAEMLRKYEKLAVPLDLAATFAGSVPEQKQTVAYGGGPGAQSMSESR